MRVLVNLNSDETVSKKEERWGDGRRERIQELMLSGDIKRL